MVGILGANSVSGEAYEISNSLRFNDGDSSQLNSTNVGTVTLGTKFTYSVWLKKTAIVTANQNILSADSGGNIAQIYFRSGSNDAIRFLETPDTYSSFDSILTTDALFRDPSAWYHIVVAYDSTDGTAANRVKIYSNGVLQTLTGTTANLNYTTPFNEASYNLDIGHSRGGEFFDGYMSDANFIDGQTLAPTDFGEVNANGVWIPKAYTGAYGTNGFYLEFKETGTGADASGMGADTSGNGNHFAVTNLAATDVTTDTPTNNFATLMPTKDITLVEGNLIMNHGRSNWDGIFASIGLTTGKWYWEHKIDDVDGDDRRVIGGIVSNPETYPHIYDGKGTTSDPTDSGTYGTVSSASPSYMYTGWATNYIFDGTSLYQSTWVDLDDNDVLGFALDLDNNKFFIAVNGTWIAADGGSDGNPATGANETFDIAAASNSRVYFPAALLGGSANTSSTKLSWNFGNPSFAISSGNADANGYGDFEYAVPSGFYSLCTKNLAEFG